MTAYREPVLNPAQKSAVDHPGGPILILAGAGSGKTATAVQRVAQLIKNGTPAARILVVTFTNKAAGEIKSRLVAACGDQGHRVTAGTFHAIGARILRLHPGLVKLRPGFLILDDDDSWALFKSLLPKADADTKDDIKNAYKLLMGARERDLSIATWAQLCKKIGAPEYAIAREMAYRYPQRLLESNGVDFPGILIGTRDIIQARPDLQQRYHHTIVDEFQDTNSIQDQIVTLLAKHSGNVTAVGDDAQAIYSFRGSLRSNILSFPSRWPGCKVIKLEENYRSRPEIIELANRVLQSKTGGAMHNKTLRATRAMGGAVVPYVADTEYDEADRLALKCKDLNARKAIAYNDQAILYRTNIQSRVIEHAMNAAGVPYKVVGGLSFWERAEIRDCVAYLRLLYNPADDIAFKRIINTPKRGIGESALRAITDTAQGLDLGPDQDLVPAWAQDMIPAAPLPTDCPDLPESCPLPFDDLDLGPGPGSHRLSLWDASERAGLKAGPLRAVRSLKALLVQVARDCQVAQGIDQNDQDPDPDQILADIFGARPDQAQGYDLVQALGQILAGIGYYKHLETSDEDTADERSANVAQLLELLTGQQDLSAFLESAALLQESKKDVTGDRVTLCTLHASKGLEWNIVYLPGFEAGIIPSPRGDLDEERRLCYVGVTRARDMLFIGRSRSRHKQDMLPSLFLVEMGLVKE